MAEVSHCEIMRIGLDWRLDGMELLARRVAGREGKKVNRKQLLPARRG